MELWVPEDMGLVVDVRHYLDEQTGDLPDGLPSRILTLAISFGSIAAWDRSGPDSTAAATMPATGH